MVRVACALGLILLLTGAFVACVPSYVPSFPTPNPTQPSSLPSSAPPSPQNLPSPTQSSHPPLNVTIDYVGIKNAYNPGDSLDPRHLKVMVIVAVNDSKTKNDPVSVSPARMGYFETRELKQRVFYTSSVGDYLNVSVRAYNILPTAEYSKIFSALGANELSKFVNALPKEALIGYYENTWYAAENWGIGSHEEKGVDNFRVWFRIWSNSEPAPIPKPEFLPDINIKNVMIPNAISLGARTNHKLTLENNENFAIAVYWKANSSVTGDFDSGTVDLPGNGSKEITKQYTYNRKGTAEITYTVYYVYNGKQLDQRTIEVSVIP